MPLWEGCNAASAPSGAGGMEMGRIGVGMTSGVCYPSCPVFPARWGCTVAGVCAQWEVIESPAGGLRENYLVAPRDKTTYPFACLSEW